MEEKESEIWLKRAQALADDINEMEDIDISASLNKVKRNIKEQRAHLFFNKLTRYAAILTLPLLFASLTLGYLAFSKDKVETTIAQVTSSQGTVIRYELPDKSVVWLNSGSKLKYPTAFSGDSRDVELVGEAYFEVKADRKHPFFVHTTSGLTVFVYGTKFNVAAYDDEEGIETVLEQGHVNIITPNKEIAAMQPGEQLIYNKADHKITKSDVDVYEKVAWKDGKMIFRNANLDVILKRLARHFNVDIQFNNRYGKEYKYRATFRNESLTQILDYLAKSANLRWDIVEVEQNDDTTITKKKVIVNLN